MDKLVKNISVIFVLVSLFNLTACDGTGFSIPSGSSSGNSSNNSNQVVRGPTGGGLGGGILIADNNGKPLSNKKYEIYYNGMKIQSGYTDSQGMANLSGNTLSDEMISAIERGSAKLEVDVFDGTEKSTAQAKLFVNTDDGDTSEIDLG